MTDQLTPREILARLGEPFPPQAIKQREGGRGMRFSYIETHTAIHRLNSATNGEWSWHVKDVQWRDDLLIVHGELAIPGLGTRSAFGVQKVSDRGGEDLVKGASSDALKKAATLFGMALELYGPDYESGEVVAQQAQTMPQQRPQSTQGRPPVPIRGNTQGQQAPSSVSPQNAGNPPSDKQWGMIRAQAKKIGLEPGPEWTAYVQNITGAAPEQLTRQQASILIDAMVNGTAPAPQANDGSDLNNVPF